MLEAAIGELLGLRWQDIRWADRRIDLTGQLQGRERVRCKNGSEREVVRLDLRYMSTKVKTAILNEDIPLGAILTNHNVLRRIEPRWFLRFCCRG